MSSSSLWVIDKNFKGEEKIGFNNSWLFSPIVLDTLYQKYLKPKAILRRPNFMVDAMFDDSLINKLNSEINKSDSQMDRVLWEFANQQIFEIQSKDIVYKYIKKFLGLNKEYLDDLGDHIYRRFDEVADSIRELGNDNAFFLFKNTSCDNNVEYWFRKYNEKNDDYDDRSLLELDEHVVELVVMENDKITNFVSNLKLKEWLGEQLCKE